MNIRDAPRYTLGFPIVTAGEAEQAEQVLETAELYQEEPIIIPLGKFAVNSSHSTSSALEYFIKHNKEREEKIGSNEKTIEDHARGITKGYYAMAGMITWVSLYREGVVAQDYLSSNYNYSDAVVVTRRAVRRFKAVCEDRIVKINGHEAGLKGKVLQESSFWAKESGGESCIRGHTGLYEKYLETLEVPVISPLDNLVNSYFESVYGDDDNAESPFIYGLYDGSGAAAVLQTIAYEANVLGGLRRGLSAWPKNVDCD